MKKLASKRVSLKVIRKVALMSMLLILTMSMVFGAIDCTNIPEWDANTVYASKTRVQYLNKVYENKWWTQGENPAESGEWGVWRYIDDCSGTPNIPPTVSLTAPASGTTFAEGEAIIVSANAADEDGTVTQVEFFAGGTSIAIDNTSPYSISWSNVPVGVHSLIAVATDNDGATTASVSISISIHGIPNESPTVSLTSPVNGDTIAEGVAMTVSANAADSDGTVTQVQFFANGVSIGTDNSSPYSISWSNGSAGTHIITAVATDNRNASTTSAEVSITIKGVSGSCNAPQYAPGNTIATGEEIQNNNTLYRCDVGGWCSSTSDWAYEPGVGAHWEMAWTEIGPCASNNQPPSVNLSSPANGSQFNQGTNITVSAIAADSDGSVVQVEFLSDGVSIGVDNSSPYSITWNNGSVGTHSLTAVATDNEGATTTSAAVSVTINQSNNQLPSVSLTAPANGTTYIRGTSITVSANASDTDGSVSGVEFFANGNSIGSDNTSPYSITWNNAAIGNYNLTAVATDNENASTTSAAINITVKSESGGDLPDRILSGYWHTWGGGVPFIKLRDVSPAWDVINISFAEPVSPGSTDGNMQFIISGLTPDYTINDFKADVISLQALGKKVVLSIGGYEGYFSIATTAAENTFVNDIINIVTEYGFDGIDIDYEQSSLQMDYGDTDINNPTSPKLVHNISAIRRICDHFGPDFMLTFAPEAYYLQMGYQWYAGIHSGVDRRAGAYAPVIHNLRDKVTYVQAQLYNQPAIMALNGTLYNSGTVEYLVSLTEMLMLGFDLGQDPNIHFTALRPDQVVIAVPASPGSAGSGHVTIEQMHQAFSYLAFGTPAGSYQTSGTYPGLRGIMAWSINWDDLQNNNSFAESHRVYLDGLPAVTKSASDITENSNIKNINEAGVEVKAYPNPFTDYATVNIALTEESQVKIKVYNTLGMEVTGEINQTLTEGTHELTINGAGLTTGMYICKVNVNGRAFSNLVLIKNN